MSKFNYFTMATVSDGYFAHCALSWPFNSTSMLILNESAAGIIVEYSFDGTTVDGNLDPSQPCAGIARDGIIANNIWFRLKSVTSPATVRFEVWAAQ